MGVETWIKGVDKRGGITMAEHFEVRRNRLISYPPPFFSACVLLSWGSRPGLKAWIKEEASRERAVVRRKCSCSANFLRQRPMRQGGK